jgi:hypothetical protein
MSNLQSFQSVLNIANETKEYWNLPVKPLFHAAISQFITKIIRFQESRKIRSNLYKLLGYPYNSNKFDLLLDSQLISIGVPENYIKYL